MKILLTLYIIIGMTVCSWGQELRCNVSISSQKIQGTNRDLFTNMQRDISEFMNNTRWSGNVFTYDERIEVICRIVLDEQTGRGRF